MGNTLGDTRRKFLFSVASAGSGVALNHEFSPFASEEAEEVSPAEDLMREHGVLRRILLIYGEAIRRVAAKQDFPPETLSKAASLVRGFIEDYHEKLEEEQLFPRFKKANTLVPLVDTLFKQHQKGRILTETVLKLATPAAMKNTSALSKLTEVLSLFVRMYEPHAAREDTVLFPAFRKIVSARDYDRLGDAFETKEHELFGENGFERNVETVEGLETTLGIHDLAQFTPNV